MKNCKLYWLSLTTAMLLASGCDDSSSSQDVPSNPSSTTACNIGTWKCDDNVLFKCIAGKWRKIKTCDDTTQCNEQTVRCDPKGNSNCTDGTWKCDGNALSKCEAGDWILKQTCDANSTCNAKIGKCTQLDQPEIKCRNTEHLFAGRCEPDDLNHCGTHTNDCTKISGWKSGNCIDKQCYASKCATGYHLAKSITPAPRASSPLAIYGEGVADRLGVRSNRSLDDRFAFFVISCDGFRDGVGE